MTAEPVWARRFPRLRWATVDLDVGAAVHAHAPYPAALPAPAEAADVWLSRDGRPLARAAVPAHDGAVDPVEIADALSWHVGPTLLRDLRTPARPAPVGVLPATVVLCTRDRPEGLARCLASLNRLSPPVQEIVVVDNNGADQETTRAVVHGAGATYVHEPRPGLSRARNAGVAAVSTEIALFTDDDVEVDPSWAAELVLCFDDPLVTIVAGLVRPAHLDGLAEQLFERWSGFSLRGLRRRDLDGASVNPFTAGGIGASASMGVRVPELRALGGMAEHLDAGTPTSSGGDTLLVHAMLMAGYRAVYQPTALAWHSHRASLPALETVLEGYGRGMMSYTYEAIRRERRPGSALLGLRSSWRYVGARAVKSALHRPGSLPWDLIRRELAGAVTAPLAFRRSLAQSTQTRAPAAFRRPGASAARPAVEGPSGYAAPATAQYPSGPPPDGAADAWLTRLIAGRPAPLPTPELPRLSVVIPTRGRRDKVVRLVRRLQDQQYDDARLEIVVAVDGDLDGTGAALEALDVPRRPRIVRLDPPGDDPHHGFGAGVARNAGAEAATGDVLLFLDDDVEPVDTVLFLAHAGGRHAHPQAPLVGLCPPQMAEQRTYFSQGVRSWWVNQTRALSESRVLSFTDVTTANLSVPRAVFAEHGGFMALARREDWELGWRLLDAGVAPVALPAAAVLHHFDTDLAGYLADVRREGAGDALLVERHPGALGALPIGDLRLAGPRRARAVRAAVEGRIPDRVVPAAPLALLRALEAAGLRGRWQRTLMMADYAQYWAGVGDALGSYGRLEEILRAGSALSAQRAGRYDAVSDELRMPGPGDASDIEVVLGDRSLTRVPVRWGGVPFDRDRFTERVIGRWESQVLAACALATEPPTTTSG